jgi:hypothetical protein
MAPIQMVDVHLPTTDGRTVFCRATPNPSRIRRTRFGDLFARPTAAQNCLSRRSGITMTTQAVVPIL